MDINSHIPDNQIGNIIILAKNKEGYQNLMELTSFANKEGIVGKPKIDLQILKTYGKEIVCIFGGENSRIGKMIQLDEKESKIIEIITMIQDIVGQENVYLEIIAQDYKEVPETKKYNEFIQKISKKTKIPCIVSNNYFYPSKEDKPAREVALAIKDGLKIYDENRRKPKGQFHIMTEEEIKKILENNEFETETIDMFIKTNNQVAESITIDIDLHQSLFPNYETPEDIKELYEANKDNVIVHE
jgi:DNA polymerase-3 subunit alpha